MKTKNAKTADAGEIIDRMKNLLYEGLFSFADIGKMVKEAESLIMNTKVEEITGTPAQIKAIGLLQIELPKAIKKIENQKLQTS